MSGPGYPQQGPYRTGPGPGWPPPGAAGPPPRRNGGGFAAIVIAVVVALVAVGTTVFLVTRQDDTGSAPGPTVGTRSPAPRSAAPRSAAPRSAAPRTTAPRSAAPRTTAPRSTPTRTARPTAPVQPEQVTRQNAFYRTPALPANRCAAMPDAPLQDVAGVEAFYSAALACLNTSWAQLRGSGLPFRPARLVVHSGEERSRCGAFAYSFYCPSELTIYMYAPEMITPWRQYPTQESHRLTRLSALHTIAHEYGHHLQQLTGIFGAAYARGVTGLAERQLELQATCLADVYLGANREAFAITSGDLANQQYWRVIVRLPNHGSGANQALWADRGYTAPRAASCNTFTAPSGTVA